MIFNDLREFLDYLEAQGKLVRIRESVDPYLEMTEISDRTLRAQGPALLFENPKGYSMPVLTNLFGTTERVALGMGQDNVAALRDVGKLLAYLKEPEPPKGFKDALTKLPMFKQVLNMPVKRLRKAPCQEVIWQGDDVDLDKIPVMSCWPDDVAPLMTWGLTITRGPHKKRQNLGIYRQQKIAKNKVIMRWLAHRGGALDLHDWIQTHPGERFPVSVAFGADPATILGAVTPIPDTLSEYAFAGLLRGSKTQVVRSISNDLEVPASAEIVLEGYIDPDEFAQEGPYGDHTGYYNEEESHHVFTVTHITMRQNPIYHSTYTGRPPDEPAVLGVALNEVFVPILQKQFPEITDFYLPPEGCSYRLAVVTIKKQYPGHAKRIMFGVWSFLRQFMYTKFVIVCDDSVNARDWTSVIESMVSHMQPKQDCTFIENTPIDSLDFASPIAGLGSKMGLDATAKWPAELSMRALASNQQTENGAKTRNSLAQIDWASLRNTLKNRCSAIKDIHLANQDKEQQMVIVTVDKHNAGDGCAAIAAIWHELSPMIEVKFVVAVDLDVNITDWNDVIWAITTRMDPKRDTYWSQDIATGKHIAPTWCGLDATNKLDEEATREWGRPIVKSPEVVDKVDSLWPQLGIKLAGGK